MLGAVGRGGRCGGVRARQPPLSLVAACNQSIGHRVQGCNKPRKTTCADRRIWHERPKSYRHERLLPHGSRCSGPRAGCAAKSRRPLLVCALLPFTTTTSFLSNLNGRHASGMACTTACAMPRGHLRSLASRAGHPAVLRSCLHEAKPLPKLPGDKCTCRWRPMAGSWGAAPNLPAAPARRVAAPCADPTTGPAVANPPSLLVCWARKLKRKLESW